MARTDNTFVRIYELMLRGGRLLGSFTRPSTCIPELNSGVHEGVAFSISDYNASLANNGVVTFSGRTGNKSIHFLNIDITSNVGGWFMELYESPTITVVGTPQTPMNLNFQSANTSDLTVKSGVTASPLGTLKLSKHIHVVGTGSANRIDSSGSLSSGVILKTNTDYLFRLTNQSGAAAPYEMTLEWAEK